MAEIAERREAAAKGLGTNVLVPSKLENAVFTGSHVLDSSDRLRASDSMFNTNVQKAYTAKLLDAKELGFGVNDETDDKVEHVSSVIKGKNLSSKTDVEIDKSNYNQMFRGIRKVIPSIADLLDGDYRDVAPGLDAGIIEKSVQEKINQVKVNVFRSDMRAELYTEISKSLTALNSGIDILANDGDVADLIETMEELAKTSAPNSTWFDSSRDRFNGQKILLISDLESNHFDTEQSEVEILDEIVKQIEKNKEFQQSRTTIAAADQVRRVQKMNQYFNDKNYQQSYDYHPPPKTPEPEVDFPAEYTGPIREGSPAAEIFGSDLGEPWDGIDPDEQKRIVTKLTTRLTRGDIDLPHQVENNTKKQVNPRLARSSLAALIDAHSGAAVESRKYVAYIVIAAHIRTV